MNLHVEGLWQGHGQRRQGLLFGLPGGINGGARYRAKQTIALVENPLIRRGLKVGDGRKTFILTHEQVLHIVAAALDFAFVLRRADTTRIYNETELLGIGCIALIERSASTGALSNPGLEIVNPHARRHAAEPKNRTVMAIKPRGHVPADAPYHCPHPAMAEYQDEGLQPHRPIAYLLNNQWPNSAPNRPGPANLAAYQEIIEDANAFRTVW